MELDDLKNTWSELGMSGKSTAELRMMTKIQNHQKVKRVRLRFVLEGVLLLFFLTTYYEALDGVEKSMWINVLLATSAVAFVAVRVIGWLATRKPIKQGSIKISLATFLKELKMLSKINQVTSALFGLVFILYFTSNLQMNKPQYMVIAALVIILFLLVFWSEKIWSSRIMVLENVLIELEEK